MKWIKSFENHTVPKDLSGDYENSSQFILYNGLEKEFISEYGELDLNEYVDIDEYIRDIGDDEHVISKLLPSNYYMRYSVKDDMFIITKKRNESLNYNIIRNDNGRYDNDLHVLYSYAGINSEYNPRLLAMSKGVVIGGISNVIKKDTYWFDIVVGDEYKGYGVSKELLKEMIKDAKSMKVIYIEAEVVNEMLEEYLDKIGFIVYRDDSRTIATMKIK